MHQPSTDLNKNPEDSTSETYYNLKPDAKGLVMVPQELSRGVKRKYVVDGFKPSASKPRSPKPKNPIRACTDDEKLERMNTSPIHQSTNTPHYTTPRSSQTQTGFVNRIPIPMNTSPVHQSTNTPYYTTPKSSETQTGFVNRTPIPMNISPVHQSTNTPYYTTPKSSQTQTGFVNQIPIPMNTSPVHQSTNTPHYTTPRSSQTQTGFASRIPVQIRKPTREAVLAEALNVNLMQIKPRVEMVQEELEGIKEEPDAIFSSDEENDETVSDVQMFFETFQDYYASMRRLDPTLYDMFGMAMEYERLLKELAGYLGELCYYREKGD